MRIRSIKPEFWRSDDIDALSWNDRLIFIGLWSYVDDNGVGIDKLSTIASDLFAYDLSREPQETLKRVSEALNRFARRGLISRYSVAGKNYLHITTWESHQKVNHPNNPRFPLPTCEDVETQPALVTPSGDSQETLLPGAVEQWSSGADKKTSSTPPASVSDRFQAFWDVYPRKVGKDDAFKAFGKAVKRAPFDEILAGIARYAVDPNLPDPEYIPHPATWLNGGRWSDDPCPPKVSIMRQPNSNTYTRAPGERKASY